MKKNSSLLSLCLIFISFDSIASFNQTPDSSSQLDRNNLIGSWQCHVNVAESEIQQTITFSQNQTYQDTGTVSLNTKQEKHIFNYNGQGTWALKPSRTLIFRDYHLTKFTSLTADDSISTIFKASVAQNTNSSGKILRLSTNNLYYKSIDENSIDLPIIKCKKIKPE